MIWKKIFSAVVGSASEFGEAIIDANDIRIFEQELGEARIELQKAQDAENNIRAQQRLMEKEMVDLNKQVMQDVAYTTQAIKIGNEALALEVAQRIADNENELNDRTEKLEAYTESYEKIHKKVRAAEVIIAEMENQLSQAKATEAIQNAQKTMHATLNHGSPSVMSAKESLKKIKERQLLSGAHIEIVDELEESESLDEKLTKAGIKNSGETAESILNKLKSNSIYQ